MSLTEVNATRWRVGPARRGATDSREDRPCPPLATGEPMNHSVLRRASWVTLGEMPPRPLLGESLGREIVRVNLTDRA
jgi:hypothetical protein